MDDKFDPLREHGTNGVNVGLGTAEVIAKLRAWDERYGIRISDVAGDRLVVDFDELPDDLRAFAREIYAFCPDTIDQHFGCFAQMFEDDDPADLPEGVAELIEGIDFDDEDYGFEILQRSLARNRKVALWWD